MRGPRTQTDPHKGHPDIEIGELDIDDETLVKLAKEYNSRIKTMLKKQKEIDKEMKRSIKAEDHILDEDSD